MAHCHGLQSTKIEIFFTNNEKSTIKRCIVAHQRVDL